MPEPAFTCWHPAAGRSGRHLDSGPCLDAHSRPSALRVLLDVSAALRETLDPDEDRELVGFVQIFVGHFPDDTARDGNRYRISGDA